MERTGSQVLNARRIAAALVLALAGCQRQPPSLGALLARMDGDPALTAPAPFLAAASLAHSTEDRLRVLKRASARGPALYAEVAAAMVADGGLSSTVALAVLDAFVAAGRLPEAFGLFDVMLEPSEHPAEYAELYLLAWRAGMSPAAAIPDLVAAADASGIPVFLVEAALVAMEGGDPAVAATMLGEAVAAGWPVHAGLLWDAGMPEAVVAAHRDTATPQDTALAADAARLTGDTRTAAALYADLIRDHSGYSWKPYAALARMAGSLAPAAAAEPVAWPHAPAPVGSGIPAAGKPIAPAAGVPFAPAMDLVGRYYGMMMERFPTEGGAVAEYAAYLASIGEVEASRRLLDSPDAAGSGVDALRLAVTPREARASAAAGLVHGRPGDPDALDAALSVLFDAAAWTAFGGVLPPAGTFPPGYRRGWFWEACRLAGEGRVAAAAEAVASMAPVTAGYEGPYDLGVLEMAAGRHGKAADAFVLAAGVARLPEDKAAALVGAGDAYAQAGMVDEARRAYEAALGSDPSSRAARAGLARLAGARNP